MCHALTRKIIKHRERIITGLILTVLKTKYTKHTTTTKKTKTKFTSKMFRREWKLLKTGGIKSFNFFNKAQTMIFH